MWAVRAVKKQWEQWESTGEHWKALESTEKHCESTEKHCESTEKHCEHLKSTEIEFFKILTYQSQA